MTDYNYPSELIKKAEERIRAQIAGNSDSIKADDIHLTVLRAGLGKFSAKTWFNLDCKVDMSQEKGKKSRGRVIQGGQLQTEIKTYLSSYAAKETIGSLGTEKIKSLPLQGFGADNQIIPLPGESLTLSEHTPCATCQGQGRSTCGECQGRGQKQCPQCHASGMTQCQFCNGRGQVPDGNQTKPCHNCQSRGHVYCLQCHGQKQIPCNTCQSKGLITCNQCNGEGVNSTHATLSPFFKTGMAINIQELDAEPKRMAGKVGGLELVTKGHADFKISQYDPDKDTSQNVGLYEDPPKDNGGNSVFYQVTMPWAVAEITLNDTPYKISFCGKKGAVAESGHFMDVILQESSDLLSMAANGDGRVAGLLGDSCTKCRVSRETLKNLTSMTPKKTMQWMAHTYPIGLSKSFIQHYVQNGYIAMKRLTRRPRYIGLGIGLTVAALINYYWFMGDGRLMASHYDTVIRHGADALPLIISMIAVFGGIKGGGYIVFHKFMKAIGVPIRKTPPMGKAGLYGFIINLAIWGGFMAMSLQ